MKPSKNGRTPPSTPMDTGSSDWIPNGEEIRFRSSQTRKKRSQKRFFFFKKHISLLRGQRVMLALSSFARNDK